MLLNPHDERPQVLVVEDNSLNAKLIQAQLESGGYSATIVGSGGAALEAIAIASYSLVLMDCALPDTDGFATTRQIRLPENPRRRNIVIGFSSNTTSSARAQCLSAGMDGYIARPVTTASLLAALSSILDSNAASEQTVLVHLAYPTPRKMKRSVKRT